MIRTLRVMSLALVMASAACERTDPPQQAVGGVELSDGRSIRLGEPDVEPQEAPNGWRTDARRKLSVATEAGRVVVILAGQGAADFPIPRYGFGVAFEELQRGVLDFHPVTVAERPGLVLDFPRSRVYALPTSDPLTCEARPQVSEVAVVAPGYEQMLATFLESQPPCKPPPPPITVFAREVGGAMEIFKRDNRTQVETRLTTNAAEDSNPRIVYRSVHRGGSRVVFHSNRDGNFEIYVMDLDGSGQRRLTSTPADDMYPDWSPDERSIVFVSSRDGNREIYVMAADGSNLRRLTDSPAIDSGPVWASNVRLNGGTDIAFYSDRDGNYEVYVMAQDGTNVRRLTDNSALDYSAAWSPDGTRIAFVSDRDGNKEVYVMNADGSAQTRLTDSAGADTAPLWSADGKRITFNSDRDGTDARYSMNADGTGQVKTDQGR